MATAKLLMLLAAMAIAAPPALAETMLGSGSHTRALQQTSVTGDTNNDKWVFAHAIILTVAFVLLLPLGILFSRHGRWIMSGKVCCAYAAWFPFHVFFQLLAFAAVVTGVVIGLVKLGSYRSQPAGNVGRAHYIIGIVLLGLVALQVIAASLLRPRPDAAGRSAFNFVHHGMGWLVVLTGWAEVFLGIYMYHQPLWAASYWVWLWPVCGVIALFLLLLIPLEVMRFGYKNHAMMHERNVTGYGPRSKLPMTAAPAAPAAMGPRDGDMVMHVNDPAAHSHYVPGSTVVQPAGMNGAYNGGAGIPNVAGRRL